MKFAISSSLLLLFGLFACNSAKKGTKEPGQAMATDALVIQMSKGACFGTCPVYTLEVFADGQVTYRGRNFTEKMGLYRRQLPETDLQNLIRDFREANLPQYDSLYLSGATDLQMTSISFYQSDYSKSVKGDFERPAAVRELEKQLIALGESGDWVQEEAHLPPGTIPNQLIIELAEGANGERWAARQDAKYGLQLIRRIAPNLNLWLFSFDDKKMAPERMLILMRQTQGVKKAEFNKNLQQRN